MKTFLYLITLCVCMLVACDNETQPTKTDIMPIKIENKGHEIVAKMVSKVGSFDDLRDKHDVVYTYSYTTPDGKSDVITEKYIFDGERSYGKYQKHERTLPEMEGVIEQGYDGDNYWFKHNSEIVKDSAVLKRVKFNRHTNFYWFAMLQKMMDPGLHYEYLGDTTIVDQPYDIVKVGFKSTPEKPTDIYQLYINQETGLMDQFLFTVADFGVMDTPLLMKVEYQNVDGILIPSKRKYKRSTWNADVDDKPWIHVQWSDIRFDNGLTINDFQE